MSVTDLEAEVCRLMPLGTARSIFEDLDSDAWTDKAKALAIYRVLNQATMNGVSKEALRAACWWLWSFAFSLNEHYFEEDANG